MARYDGGGDTGVFEDREHAGARLGDALSAYRGRGALVLGIPRGGVPVAAEVARRIDADLDVVVARKLGAPGAPELAIGAVAADGERFLNEDIIRDLRVSPGVPRGRDGARIRGGAPARATVPRPEPHDGGARTRRHHCR